MRILSWNCNCKFREKFKEIIKYDADIYVIQECENPKEYVNTEYIEFAKNYFWCGDNQNKGLGIFAKDNIRIEQNNWKSYCLRNFLSVRVNDKFNVVGVWACNPYIAEYYIYQNINIDNYDDNTIIIGDFNSNKIWDKDNKLRNHSTVVKELQNIGLESIYHYIFNEEQGKEKMKTFYLYRHLDKGYHIDHCFANKETVEKYQILFEEKWLKYSDHIPIMLETKDI